MMQEHKELLLKDLCARLLYGVKVAFFNEDLTYHAEPKTLIQIECINNLGYSHLEDEDGNATIIEFVKPYLLPLSSMTEEQKAELEQIKNSEDAPYYHDINDFFLKYHLDNRHLIEKGLAIDATGLNIY